MKLISNMLNKISFSTYIYNVIFNRYLLVKKCLLIVAVFNKIDYNKIDCLIYVKTFFRDFSKISISITAFILILK